MCEYSHSHLRLFAHFLTFAFTIFNANIANINAIKINKILHYRLSFSKISQYLVARSLELCSVYGNRLTLYYMGLITQMVKSGCALRVVMSISAYPFGDKRRDVAFIKFVKVNNHLFITTYYPVVVATRALVKYTHN
ncbi:hypothetical protein SFRURICE_002192 [Spodoptera frugiperda]|nr:hypothetical protein SFRURICE_002192 [Spodoptera frugiperda]